MSAKQELLDYVGALTEGEAQMLLDRIHCDALDEGESAPLSEEQIAFVRRSLRQLDEGKGVPQSEVRRMFGLA